MFIGRKKELLELSDTLSSDKFEATLIYGRRRVGKTELINESLKIHQALNNNELIISLECINSSIKENLLLFTNKLKNIFNEKFLHFDSFIDLFEYIFIKSINQKIILFIDEFSYLLSEDFTIESMLACIIDQYKNKTKLKLIISGSNIYLIEKMASYESHCFGRFTHILYITPFNYYDSSLFYPNYSDEDKILMYSVFGGVPFFNSLIDNKKSAIDNILDLIIKKNNIIVLEINYTILLETNKISNMNNVLSLIARGVSKYSDIKNAISNNTNVKPDYLLNKLLDMKMIKKIVPINDENNKKKMYYKLNDNLISFYFTYIFPNNYQELRDNPHLFFEKFIKEDLYEKYLPSKFEDISREYLIKANLESKINPYFQKIGTYFYNDQNNKINRQFDLVTKDEYGYISYECKYTNNKISNKEINEEIFKSKGLELDFYKLGFISKSGFIDNITNNNYNLISLNDFYK